MWPPRSAEPVVASKTCSTDAPTLWRVRTESGAAPIECRSNISSLNSSLAQVRPASPTEPLSQEVTTSQPVAQRPLVIRQEDLCDNDFERLDVLGRGFYSIVVSARHLPSQQIVALKEISRRRLRELGVEAQLHREINVHRRLRHPNIVRMLSYYITPQSVVLVLELCPRGTLMQKLRGTPGGRFDEPRSARYLRHAARALAYLHRRGIVHRDLKLENILLDADGVARLGDFGWSRTVVDPTAASAESSPLAANPTPRLTVCGTLDYLSPEMLRGKPHSVKTDVWSLGAMLAEMLTGAPPFYRVSQEDTLEAIREAPPQLGDAEGISGPARELILAMLRKDPEERPMMEEVLRHPWTRQEKRGCEREGNTHM